MDIIFWLNTPPVACRGVFNEVSRLWEGNTYYICAEKMSKERMLTKDDKTDYGDADYIEIDSTSKNYIEQFIFEHKDDFHIFNGYKGVTSKYIDQIYSINEHAKIIIWAERPAYRGTGIKKEILSIPYKLNHMKYTYKYKNKITAFLPLGTVGVDTYRKLGWPKEKMFPFMYLPVMQEELPECKTEAPNSPRFVYVGRFRKMWKGVGILIKACDILSKENYSIEFVGGYGEDKEEVMAWINKTPQASFGGTWPINEVCSRLQQYDVCIVPSYYEGWNVTVNQAIMAGIGCICTDQAVSDELIQASKSGLIVKAESPDELAEAMKKTIQNHCIIEEWKKNAINYRTRISSKSCAKYFLDILNYTIGNNNRRPVPPWLG